MRLRHRFRHFTPHSAVAVAVVGIVVVLGAYMMWTTHAATSTVSVEAESGSLTGAASRLADTNASNGAAVQFGTTTPPSGGGKTINVTTAAELTSAMSTVQPGDTIHLADGVYSGATTVGKYGASFASTRAGTASAPVTLTGSGAAVIDGSGARYGLYLVGANYWNVTGITVTHATKGIVLDGSNHVVLDGLHVYNISDEGVHFRAFSSDNVIKNSLVEQTGVSSPQYGEGVYLGSANSNWGTYSGGKPDTSDRNQVLNNTIRNTGAENVDIKEGSTGGLIDGNSFDGIGIAGKNSADSWIDVKGNGYTVTNNKGTVSGPSVFQDGFQIHNVYTGWGQNNVFHHNTLDVHAPGYGFYVQSGATGNVIGCDNTVTNAGSGFAGPNVTCTP